MWSRSRANKPRPLAVRVAVLYLCHTRLPLCTLLSRLKYLHLSSERQEVTKGSVTSVCITGTGLRPPRHRAQCEKTCAPITSGLGWEPLRRIRAAKSSSPGSLCSPDMNLSWNLCTFPTAICFPSRGSLRRERRQRDAIGHCARMAGAVPVKPGHTATPTTALITSSVQICSRVLSKVSIFYLYTPGMVPAHRRCPIN